MISRKLISSRRWSTSNVTSLSHCSYVLCLCLNAVPPERRCHRARVSVLVRLLLLVRTTFEPQPEPQIAETMRRCSFFFDVFGLELPEYLRCNIFSDAVSVEQGECVGMAEYKESMLRSRRPVKCSGFLCDKRRCIPNDWRCDGHVDCQDQTDESHCDFCGASEIHCGSGKCMSQKHMCNGVQDCPFGQDERNCSKSFLDRRYWQRSNVMVSLVRLSERNGDLGRGTLEVYKADLKQWTPACVKNWDPATSPTMICSMLGYSSVNSSRTTMRGSNRTLVSTKDASLMWRMFQKKHTNMLKEFNSCDVNTRYPVAELTCSNYGKFGSSGRRQSLN